MCRGWSISSCGDGRALRPANAHLRLSRCRSRVGVNRLATSLYCALHGWAGRSAIPHTIRRLVSGAFPDALSTARGVFRGSIRRRSGGTDGLGFQRSFSALGGRGEHFGRRNGIESRRSRLGRTMARQRLGRPDPHPALGPGAARPGPRSFCLPQGAIGECRRSGCPFGRAREQASLRRRMEGSRGEFLAARLHFATAERRLVHSRGRPPPSAGSRWFSDRSS
jgi:hypothetical protein